MNSIIQDLRYLLKSFASAISKVFDGNYGTSNQSPIHVSSTTVQPYYSHNTSAANAIIIKRGFFICVLLALSLFSTHSFAQQKVYSVANAHAHNDYEHPVPFYTAYNAGFGSIEADIFLYKDSLVVSHNVLGINPAKTLQALYLNPLKEVIRKNKGLAYKDSAKNLLLLIDLKTAAEPTLDALVKLLQQYKTLTDCPTLKIVITGNQPDVSKLTSYPSYLYFDGNINKTYPAEALTRIALFSDNFRNYAQWTGEGPLTDSTKNVLETAVTKAHALNKPIRFWAAPDVPNAWSQLMKLNVDYINTDKIPELSEFFKNQSATLHKER